MEDALLDDEGDPDEWECRDCRGDGWVDGYDLAQEDPFWYDEDQIYRCPNCGGSGKAKDMTYW